MAVDMQPVTSSNVAEIGHDKEQGLLHVKFKSGGTWTYPDPDGAHFRAMQGADSVGKYFHQNFRAGGIAGTKL